MKSVRHENRTRSIESCGIFIGIPLVDGFDHVSNNGHINYEHNQESLFIGYDTKQTFRARAPLKVVKINTYVKSLRGESFIMAVVFPEIVGLFRSVAIVDVWGKKCGSFGAVRLFGSL